MQLHERLALDTVRSLISGGSFFFDPLSPNLRTEGNFQARFSRSKSIEFNELYRFTSSFFALLKYFDTHFWWQCAMPGVVWWVVWAESPIQI